MNAKVEGREYFGFLRLFFASMVILSHTPELYDGNRSEEILTNIFGTIPFGALAVDSFFFISGYLISQSYLNTRSPVSFLLKRIRRIYPAFLVASLVCVFVVAPLGDGTVPHTAMSLGKTVIRALLLFPPDDNNAFLGSNYPALNGAMWTITYEFKCYLMVLVLGMTGLLQKRRLVLALSVLSSIVCIAFPVIYVPFSVAHVMQPAHAEGLARLAGLFGDPRVMIQLVTLYLFGILFRLYREKIRLSTKYLLVAALLLVACLFVTRLSYVAIGLFWGYAILFFARFADKTVFSRLNEKNDISYGVYLYAWPIQKLIFFYYPGIGLVMCGVLTFFCSVGMGTLSWLLIEKRFVHQHPKKPTLVISPSET